MELNQYDLLKFILIFKSIYGPLTLSNIFIFTQMLYDYNEFIEGKKKENDYKTIDFDDYNKYKDEVDQLHDYKPTYKYEDDIIIIELID